MRKALWILATLPLAVTACVFQFLPDKIPAHYNFAGEIDRWGSKYENLLFPIIIIALTLFWHLFIRYFEKKAIKTQVQEMTKLILKLSKVPKPDDTADAVAMAICHGHSSGTLKLKQGI